VTTFDDVLKADAEYIANDVFGVDVVYLKGGNAFDQVCVRAEVDRRVLESFGLDDGNFRRKRARVRIPRLQLDAVVPGKDMIQGIAPGEGQPCEDCRVANIVDNSDLASWNLEVHW
jgi:hypothetical protein